jgi:hypothetical protein
MAEIFNIQLETDLSEFDSTVTDGGDLSQAVAAALAASSGGLSCLIDDTNSIYGQKNFTELTSVAYRFRFYVDPNSLTMAGSDDFQICRILNSSNGRCQAWLRYDGSSYEIRARVIDDSLTWNATSNYDISDAEHYVEIQVQYATSDVASDGTLTLWIDGAQQELITGLDIYDISKPDNARLGAVSDIDAGTSGTLYLDEFVFRDDTTVIGPVAYAGFFGLDTAAHVWLSAVTTGTTVPVIMHHRQQQGQS